MGVGRTAGVRTCSAVAWNSALAIIIICAIRSAWPSRVVASWAAAMELTMWPFVALLRRPSTRRRSSWSTTSLYVALEKGPVLLGAHESSPEMVLSISET